MISLVPDAPLFFHLLSLVFYYVSSFGLGPWLWSMFVQRLAHWDHGLRLALFGMATLHIIDHTKP